MERVSPCTKCPKKPCMDNPYNSDQDCWYHPDQNLIIRSMVELVKMQRENDLDED